MPIPEWKFSHLKRGDSLAALRKVRFYTTVTEAVRPRLQYTDI